MFATLPAVFQEGGVLAAGVFEGVGEDGEAVEGSVLIDGLSQRDNIAGKPERGEGHRMERITEDITDDPAILSSVSSPIGDSFDSLQSMAGVI